MCGWAPAWIWQLPPAQGLMLVPGLTFYFKDLLFSSAGRVPNQWSGQKKHPACAGCCGPSRWPSFFLTCRPGLFFQHFCAAVTQRCRGYGDDQQAVRWGDERLGRFDPQWLRVVHTHNSLVLVYQNRLIPGRLRPCLALSSSPFSPILRKVHLHFQVGAKDRSIA